MSGAEPVLYGRDLTEWVRSLVDAPVDPAEDYLGWALETTVAASREGIAHPSVDDDVV